MTYKQFKWQSFNITEFLHDDWDKEILHFSKKNAVYKLLTPCSITSRERRDVYEVETLTVDGLKIRSGLPWLFDLYKSTLLELGKNYLDEELFLANDDMYALNLNIQYGNTMRYECHVDSNPLQGILYATSHQKGDGGELVVSNNSSSIGVEEISENCEIIYPEKGMFYLFNANDNPHFVRPLKEKNATRVAVTINFYTVANPEELRPKDLNNHLF